MAPGDLEQALSELHIRPDPNLLTGFQAFDKGVYQINQELALVQTVDFFTPIVDNPYRYGQIAAANAVSDVYAMGGRPVTAMNIVAFPCGRLNISILRDILRGSIDKLNEAETTLVGGHSIEDDEIKYGLSITGVIDPRKIIHVRGAMAGDQLLLTKPLGTGIINTAIKAGLASPAVVAKVEAEMATLNRKASEVMRQFPVHACTDVTGFGLIGHLAEMIAGLPLGAVLDSREIPYFPEALAFAEEDVLPGGANSNRKFRDAMVVWSASVPVAVTDILYDPQTSGGLLMAVAPAHATALLQNLHQEGVMPTRIIGTIVADPGNKIRIM